MRLFDERIDGNEFVDQDFDGSRSFSYAVVPAMENVLGEEVLGIGLDYVTVVQLSPTDAGVADRFVGHVSFR